MSVTINGTTGIDKITDGSIVADDLASTLDLSSKTITLATDAAVVSKLSTASGSAPSYSARAWVNFNGTGTVAINGSGNVSSITDVATGIYTINFTTAMPDENYSAIGTVKDADASMNTLLNVGFIGTGGTYENYSTTSFTIGCHYTTTQVDSPLVAFSIFR